MSDGTLLAADVIDTEVRRLAAELSAVYDDGVVLVGLLKSCVIFLADLVRAMTISPVVDFLAITPYTEGTGRVRIVKDLDLDVVDRDVVVVDAVMDTGLTLSYLLGEIGRRGPRSVEVCALLDKRARRVVPVEARFVGFVIDDPYVVGYGLDHDERYRNVGAVSAADPIGLSEDPDQLVPRLYTRG